MVSLSSVRSVLALLSRDLASNREEKKSMPTRRQILMAGLGSLTLSALPAWARLVEIPSSSPSTTRRDPERMRVVAAGNLIVLNRLN